jgi:hypothetical protein
VEDVDRNLAQIPGSLCTEMEVDTEVGELRAATSPRWEPQRGGKKVLGSLCPENGAGTESWVDAEFGAKTEPLPGRHSLWNGGWIWSMFHGLFARPGGCPSDLADWCIASEW